MKVVVIGDYTVDVLIKNIEEGHGLCLKSGISISAGGVGRNIALNLKRDGIEPLFVTAYGSHGATAVLDADRIKHGLRVRNFNTGGANVFCALLSADGNIEHGYYMIEELEKIPVASLTDCLAEEAPECLVMDGNLQTAQLQALQRWCLERNIRFALDAVAVPKAGRLRGIICGCILAKFNRYEAGKYFDYCIENVEDAEFYARKLIAEGAKNAIISLGAAGCVFASVDTVFWRQAVPVKSVSENGAGDAMFASALHKLLQGGTIDEAADCAMLAAAEACASEESVFVEK